MPDYSLACQRIALPKTNGSCTHNGREMIASKKLRAKTVLWPQPVRGLPMAKAVLIVDDNALIRQALCEMFKREPTLRYAEKRRTGERRLKKLSSCILI
jgi:hypothetical protein